MNQPKYDPPQPTRLQLNSWTIGVIIAGVLAGGLCICAVFLVIVLVFFKPPPPPATPRPATAAVSVPVADTPIPTVPPTLNPANVGKFVNPFFSANLQGMTLIQIDVLDTGTGNYVRAAQLTGTDMDKFIDALNVSVKTVAPNTRCPDHVRLSITKADTSVVTIGLCLDHVVILRGDIADMEGVDAPMYPGFSDALAPYLPEPYKQLLDF